MNKLIRAVALALAILVGTVAPAAEAVSDHGNPAITRLWMSGKDSDRFVCTASYTQPYLGTHSLSVILTAGHCQNGTLVKRNANTWISGVVRWIGALFLYNPALTNRHADIAIGVVPDVRDDNKRDKLWLANETPGQGSVYIHGFPAGIESVTTGFVVHPALNKEFSLLVPVGAWGSVERRTLAELIPGTRIVITAKDSIKDGSSGSPILNEGGRVVGILWGSVPHETLLDLQFKGRSIANDPIQIALFTPIERVHELLKLLELK